MKKFIFIFLFIPIFAFGQSRSVSEGTLRVQVFGDTVILYQDTVHRNCCAMYDMVVWREADTLYWLQKDIGGICYCMCHYNLSVAVDSLEAGHYTAKVYWSWPFPEFDTVYVGSIDFDITTPGSNQGYAVIDEYQSVCFPVGIDEIEDEPFLTFYPNPCKDQITFEVTGNVGKSRISILHTIGQEVIGQEINDRLTLFDVNKISRGVYFILLTTEKTVHFEKLIIE